MFLQKQKLYRSVMRMNRKTGKNNGNGKEFLQINKEKEHENIRLRRVLQKVVLKENAPEHLRDAINKMIRQ